MADELSVVGKHLPRVDAVAKVKGEATYVPDMQLPGMLHARFLRSPHPHARIVKINTKKAESLPGVRGVLTHKNVPKVHPRNKLEYLLNETLLYAGDEVAMVAAETKEIAEEALKLIEVEYEVLPAVFDAEEAMQPDAPLVHPEHGSNVYHGAPGCTPEGWISLNIGDVDKGFAEADYIVDGTYETPMQHGVSPMPRSAIARWNGNKLTCWADTMAPMNVWFDLARCLNMPQSDVRLIVERPVGELGRKEPEKTTILTALMAKRTGRPVKTAFTREEDFIASKRRLDYKTYGKIGVKQDGTITAVYHRAITNCGADAQSPLNVMATTVCKAFVVLYRSQNARSEGCTVLTNTNNHGAVLGFGDPEGDFCIDRLADEAAEKIGMDPIEFRLKNCVRYGDKTYERMQLLAGKDPRRGIAGPDLDMQEVITRAADKADWKKKWRGWTTPVEVSGAKRRGIGIAMGIHHCMHNPYSAAVKMNQDGTANVLTCAVEHGQGCATIMIQVVAEALGLHYEDVNATMADTAATPLGSGNAGSSGTGSAVNAAKLAAEDARRKLFEIAARALDSKPDDLEAKDRRIYVRSNPEKGISIADACRLGYQVMGVGLNPSPNSLRDEKTGELLNALAIAVVVAEVEVDTDTGELNVISMSSANDCGRAINPAMVENQIDLGVVMGNGWIRSENFVIDKSTGVLLNPNLLDYKLMTFLDIPKGKDTQVSVVENPTSWGPYGAKGFSETAMVAVAPAIANAVYNAIGVRIRGTHFTPDRILEALGK
jgi:xanthine dehydrogenase molybdenum-binding subunit